MSFLEEPLRGSVAPPGWNSPPELSQAPSQPALSPPALSPPAPSPAVPMHGTAGGEATHAAVRWRARRGSTTRSCTAGTWPCVACLLHWQVASLAHLIWAAVAGVVYRFGLEARDGQTIGKRRYGIRVVAADGGPAGARAIAIRSVLRLVDALPVCYVFGLLSMLRTGPARRQRLGDIAAGTIVVAVDGRAVIDGTAGWMLPAATLGAVIATALSVIAIAEVGLQPASLSPLRPNAPAGLGPGSR